MTNTKCDHLPLPLLPPFTGDSDSIPWSVVHEQTEYIKVRHRSDDPLAFWTHRGLYPVYNVNQAQDIRRLAALDALHQDQLQHRALRAGVITSRYSTVPDEDPQDYASVPSTTADLAALNTSTLQSTPVDATLHSTGVSLSPEAAAAAAESARAAAAARGEPAGTAPVRVTTGKDAGDGPLGFPRAVPLAGILPDAKSFIGSIDRWPASLLTRRLCRMAYEEPNKPLMITGMVELAETGAPEGHASPLYTRPGHAAPQDPAAVGGGKVHPFKKPATPAEAKYPAHFWTLEDLKTQPFAEATFRLGDSDEGDTLRAKMKVFLQYLAKNTDDSPLYLFEDSVDRCDLSRPILSLYRVPSFFRQDLVTDVIPPHQRPPYQWLLVGPQRSGTRMHLDPRCTSAWNMSTTGRKRWVLMKPGIPANIAKGHIVMTPAEIKELSVRGNPQAVYWFTFVLPRLRRWIQERERKREIRLHNAAVAAGTIPGPALPADAGLAGVSKAVKNTFLAPGMVDAEEGARFWGSVTAGDSFGLDDPFLSVDADEVAVASGAAVDSGNMADDEDAADAAAAAAAAAVSAGDRARALAKAKRIKWDELADGYGFCEFIQYPGETIFVPSGWWHAVINVDDTIAYTQNFTNMANFPLVWRNMRAQN